VARFLYRLGHVCARGRWIVVAVWIVLAAGAVLWVHAIGAKTDNNLSLPGTDSQRAFNILAAKFPPQQNGTNPFVFHVDTGKLTDPKNEAALDATYAGLKKAQHVYSVRNPVGKNGKKAGILSKDERTGIMPVLLNINSGFITVDLAHKALAATLPARKAGIQVAVGGSIGSALSQPETRTSEILGNVAAMVILAIVFGSLVAMGTPIVTAIFALAVAISAIGLLGHVFPIPSVGTTIATMIGLGVGIDYALFMVTKHLELLVEEVPVPESIARSVASSGSAIVFAGSTVVIALLSLAVAGIPLVSALGVASATAVLTAVLASITLLPAILAILGHGVQALAIPRFLQIRQAPPGTGRWDTWARWVTSHPWIAVAIAAVILIPLIIPLFSLRLGQSDVGVTPKDTTQRQAYDLLKLGFGVGYNGPLLIATQLDPPAHPSAKYTKKYDEATSLQAQLEKEQKELTAQANALKQQQAVLEAQQRALQRSAASLRRQEAALQARKRSLEAQQAALQRQAASLERQAQTLARRAAPLVARLAFINGRERLVRHLIATTTDPDRLRRLRRRLARLQTREARVRARLAPLVAQGRSLVRRARALQAQAAALQRQADALQRQADALQRQAARLAARGARLKQEGAALQRQADALKQQQAAAERQKQKALNLKAELTAMLTKAGGDDRGTDPRIVKLQDGLDGADDVASTSPPQINHVGDAAIMSVIAVTAPSAPRTAELVKDLRTTTIPASTAEGGIDAHVGGTTASNVDLAAKISSRMPLVVATVVGLSFLLLMLAFRSLLVPVQAAVTNLLSVAAALGVLTATFQWGWGLALVGLDAPRGTVPIASYVPLMMFAVLFGLSMDYEVFLMSRIQQHHAAGEDPRSAVVSGLGASARVVTAAASIMFLVFASFIINGDPTVKQFGVGLATAVFLAGTMVVLLAPAMLSLFGRGVFVVPRFLDRILPHIDIEGGLEPGPVAEPEATT
jgi:uncharacterized membrane protein YdfJ with MMPL/SSD domain